MMHNRLSKLTNPEDPLLNTNFVANRHDGSGIAKGELEVRRLMYKDGAHIPSLNRRIKKVHLSELV
jgi:hypothetical protein